MLLFILSHHISTVVNVFLSVETLENKSYDLSAHCPRQAAVWYSHTGEKDRPSHVHFYTCCLTAWARADMAEEWLWYSIRNGLYGTVSAWRFCLYLVNWATTTKIWDLTRKCPGFSWKHHVLLRLSQQASLHSPGGCRSPFAKYGPPLPCNAQNPPLLLQCQPRFRLCDKGSFHRRRVSPEFD